MAYYFNLGPLLANNESRIALGLRLSAPLVRAHQCVCGAEMEANGHHCPLASTCRRSAGRHRRHALANEIVMAIRSIEVHADLEPSRLLKWYGKRLTHGTAVDI